MKLCSRLRDVLANCSSRKADKECIEYVKKILKEKNKKSEEQTKELFEFLANIIYEDLERDILKIKENGYQEVLCDFLFYLFKYMRRVNVKKCYKLVRKVTIMDVSTSDNTDNMSDGKGDGKGDQVKNRSPFRMVPFLLSSNILIYLEMLKREDSKNMQQDEHYFYQSMKNIMMSKKYVLMLSQVIGSVVTKFPNFPHFIDTSFNLYLYVRNGLVPFFLKNVYKRITDLFQLKGKEINTKFTVKKYYGFLFYVYFIYKLKIITCLHLNPSSTYSLLNDSVQLSTILDLYSHVLRDYKNILHLCFTVISNKKNNKTVLNTFCLAIIYLVNLLHANHNDILNVFPESTKNNSSLFKKYRDVFSMYRKLFDAMFKLSEEPSFSLSKVKLAVFCNLSSGRFNNHFVSKREKQRKEKWMYRQNYATKEGQTRDGQIAHTHNADQNKAASDSTNLHREANNLIVEWLAKKKGHISKQELVQLTYRTVTEHDYSCFVVFSFLYMLTRRFIRLYDFSPVLHDIVFCKPFRIGEIIMEMEASAASKKQSGNSVESGNSVKSSKRVESGKRVQSSKRVESSKRVKSSKSVVPAKKIPTTELANILYNNAFLNLLKDKLCLYLNIDGNILNLFFMNELYKFVNNRDLNYKNLHYLLAHDTGTRYYRMNVLLLLQKIVLRNVLRYALSLGGQANNGRESSGREKSGREKSGREKSGREKSGKEINDQENNGREINEQENNGQENDCEAVGDQVDAAHLHAGGGSQLALLFTKQNKKLKMLNINEFALGTKELKAAAEKKEENTFTILKSIDFVDITDSAEKKSLQFDMNIINIAVNQLTKESFTTLKSLISLQNKKKDQTKMYMKNLRSLEILLKCTYNFVNEFLAIIHLTKLGKKCILCCNGKRQHILCTQNYYEKVKNKKKKIKTTEREVHLQFEPTFGKKCAKRNNFLVVKKLIKLCVSIMKKGKKNPSEEKQKRRHCNIQTVELSKVIFFFLTF
ncbi:hypothetical protein PCYB_146290 [Plasmodium cynomolgi strain B]|uniref:Uncharacterized protein n=1 Tax=Plasmodium cynomolgi (strain B) TaxID=1120755 RepID=K6V1X5_PLACD|nr:hypothetical protein PCYB_146290 [Plasmodium cynomolgi strain B]GAB69200.1 hypothetical protein PCYB_146290 [Plasmodium cynomolgi strain B]